MGMNLGESITTTTKAPAIAVQPVDIEVLQEQFTELNETMAAQEKSRQIGTWITLGILLIRLFKK